MKMNKAVVDARRNKIMQKIQSQGKAAVEDLAEELQVSPLTIRRDLQFWEEMGASGALLRRCQADSAFCGKR